MREILYRAKRVDNGEWIEGDLIRKYDKDTSEPSYYIVCCRVNGLSIPCYFEAVECVIPDTVCEFTGLLDKNGKKIFEGDIILYTGLLEKSKNKVIYEDGYWLLSRDNYYNKNEQVKKYLSRIETIKIEVIGNKFDNPELVEKVEE